MTVIALGILAYLTPHEIKNMITLSLTGVRKPELQTVRGGHVKALM